jgi:putative acetyltransferase
MTIRRAVPADRGPMLELWEHSARATHLFLSEADVAGLRPLVAAELAGDGCDWWVAAGDREQLLGFLGYSPNVIEGLFVEPAHRGRGVGTRLVVFAQQLTAGALRVDVNEQNSAARGFYESLGFTVAGRSTAQDALIRSCTWRDPLLASESLPDGRIDGNSQNQPSAAWSAAANCSSRVHSPSNRWPLMKNVGVPFTPLRTPLMKSASTRGR